MSNTRLVWLSANILDKESDLEIICKAAHKWEENIEHCGMVVFPWVYSDSLAKCLLQRPDFRRANALQSIWKH